MQISKIHLNATYAIKLNTNGKPALARFYVNEIHAITTNNPYNQGGRTLKTYRVGGVVDQNDMPGKNVEERSFKLDPEKLLGDYEEHVELVAKRDAERAQYKAECEAERATMKRLCEVFTDLTGIAFSVERFGSSIRIEAREAGALVKALQALNKD